MWKLFLLASAWSLFVACNVGDCGEEQVIPIASGTYAARPDETFGGPLAGIQHAGAIERMEVDKTAGLVRLHGTTDEGQAFVETYRIAKRTTR